VAVGLCEVGVEGASAQPRPRARRIKESPSTRTQGVHDLGGVGVGVRIGVWDEWEWG